MLGQVREWIGNVAEVVSRYRKQNPNQQTQIKMKTKQLFLGAAIVASTVSPLAAVTLLNDTFSDNERATQSLTGSAEWAFSNSGASNSNTSLSASTGALVYTATTSSGQFSTAYFAPSGSPVGLADGESITLSFNFSLSSIVANEEGLRFGIFNSNGTRFATGFSSAELDLTSTVHEPTRGYLAAANPGATTGTSTFSVREKFNNSGTTPFSSTGAIGPNNTAAYLSLAAATTYSAMFSITRSGANAVLSSTINGITQTGTDTGASAGFNFDQISIFTNSAPVPTNATFTVDNVNVTVIPEPSAALLGALGSLALLRRRR